MAHTIVGYPSRGQAPEIPAMRLKSNSDETLLYIGTRGEPGKMLGKNSGELLKETFKGHFPGSSLVTLDNEGVDSLLDGLVSSKDNPASTVTAVSSVPSLSTDDQEHFMQGLERFIDAAENRTYEGLILAEPVSVQNLNTVRAGYEQVATQLSSLAKRQFSYGIQDSSSVSLGISQSLSQSLGESLGLTESKGVSETSTTSQSTTNGTSNSVSSPDKGGKLLGIGAMALGTLAGGPIGAMVGGQVAGMFASTNTTGTSHSATESSSQAHSTTSTSSRSKTTTSTDTRSQTDTQTVNQTQGNTQQISYEITDKTIEGLLDKIDHHLERVNEAKTYGGWHTAAYFIGDGAASTEALASIFLGLIRGAQSNTEDFALTTWNSNNKKSVIEWLGKLMHPRLKPAFNNGNSGIEYLTPATLVSGKEMALQLSLPRRSTSTVVVQETAAFGRKVQLLDSIQKTIQQERTIELGNIRHLWSDLPQKISLNIDHLSSHTFVTGSTGSGKSNTVYEMLEQLSQKNIPFMVIEPAKGEYKHVFGNRENVSVFGTNNRCTELLKINPFSFPEGTHVLEHVDRLIEIFNVCWPMYAAMPAILKDAILQSYEQCGWDLLTSNSLTDGTYFPTFSDLLLQLDQVIEDSSYSQEMKSNYAGALLTRVKSLANGLNGQIFSADEIENSKLFDSNVVIDLSRVGSQETKSLIMGLLIIKLSEYRADSGKMNQPLKHVTVLEEAHNILSSSLNSGSEGSSVAEKSVEMLSNAIAEMRTYGEGFIIADQSPSAVHISAIRNTNTKIIMRLPDEADRRLAGKSAALSDEQLDELARLPKGVAVVYQNDWLEAVLCKINRFSGEELTYQFSLINSDRWSEKEFRHELIQWLLRPRLGDFSESDPSSLRKKIIKSSIATPLKIELDQLFKESSSRTKLLIHTDSQFNKLSEYVMNITDCKHDIEKLVKSVSGFNLLHEQFEKVITDKLGELPKELTLTIEQCFMKNISNQGSDFVRVYAGWKKFITQEVL